MGESRNKKETKKEKKTEEQTRESDSEKDTSSRHKKGVAESMLKGLSDFMPGLGGLMKGLEKSKVFHERLKEVDKEVEKRVRETPLKTTSGTGAPHLKESFKTGSGIRRKKEVLKDVLVDIFDEHKHIDVIAEIPGVEEKDIKVDLNADILTITADAAELKYFKKIRLPCKPKAILKKLYKNGVMEIKLKKE